MFIEGEEEEEEDDDEEEEDTMQTFSAARLEGLNHSPTRIHLQDTLLLPDDSFLEDLCS